MIRERGVRLGVDVGRVRVGIAISDPDGILATPLVTLTRGKIRTTGATAERTPQTHRSRDGVGEPGDLTSDLAEIARLVAAHDTVEVVVGLPITLAGQEGAAAAEAREYARRLADVIAPVPVRLTDERMSTVVASRRLSERGVKGRRQRAVVDQAAAVEILQSWLDTRRRRAG